MIKMIAAVSKNNQIGMNNQMPWHIPEDLQYFKQITSGTTVLMGRKTYESIGCALPNRRNIVLTRDLSFSAPHVEVLHSFNEALRLSKQLNEIFIIGGGEIYQLFLPFARQLYLTFIDLQTNGDTLFPDYQDDFNCQWKSELQFSQGQQIPFTFTIWERNT